MFENLPSKVKIPTVNKQETGILAIIGQGYVGLPLAMAAVDAGWTVIGVDSFEAKVAQINGGSSPVEDITDSRLKAALINGFYKATTDYSLVSNASVITLCVPSPLNQKREPDLTLLLSAAKGIAPFLSNETLVVTESTSYPGTLRNEIIPIVNKLRQYGHSDENIRGRVFAFCEDELDLNNVQFDFSDVPVTLDIYKETIDMKFDVIVEVDLALTTLTQNQIATLVRNEVFTYNTTTLQQFGVVLLDKSLTEGSLKMKELEEEIS